MPAAERKAIGEEIRTVQFGWSLGMPLVRKLDVDLWEVRVRLKDRLHDFIKKSQKISDEELAPAAKRN